MKLLPARCEAILITVCFLVSSVVAQQPDDKADAPNRVAVIEFNGEINPLSENFFYRQLEKAKAANVDVVVVEIDSPGGHVTCSLDLANTLCDVEWAKTVAYVPREAISGGAIMSLGCDEIVIEDGARIGDAGPIFQGDDALFRHAPEKIRSHLVASVRRLADHYDRPPALAEAMVDMDLVVFKVTHRKTGEVTFMSNPELDSMDDPEVWEKGPPVQESREGLFLELRGDRAVELQLAQAIINNRRELAARYNTTEDELLEFQTSWVDGMVMLLNWWPMSGLLLLIGIIALYVEFSAPGIGIGGLLAGLCFMLFFWSRFLGGTAGWLEVILFLGGVAFLLVEMFVIPGFGFAGLTGGLLIVASLLMAGQEFTPSDGLPVKDVLNSMYLLIGIGFIGLLAMIFISKRLGSIPIFNRLSLPPPPAELTPDTLPADATSAIFLGVGVGDHGVADSPLRPAGRAIFGDQYVDVVTDGSFIDQGDSIKVIDISGNRIMVRKLM